jgi:hypothetical protein
MALEAPIELREGGIVIDRFDRWGCVLDHWRGLALQIALSALVD